MVTTKLKYFIGLVITFFGIVAGVYNLTKTEIVPGYIFHSLIILLCFFTFIFFFRAILKKGKK